MEGLEERDDLNILNQRKRINLAPPDWKHFDIIAKNAKEAEKIGGQPAMQRYVLSEPLAQNDLEKWTSALAYMIDRYRRGSHKLKAGSEYEIQHVTHDIVIADFLRKAVIFKNEKGERTNYDFNKEEAINYLEGFNLIIKLDENGEEDIKILFRGQEVDVDEKKLSELVHKYKENPHSGRMTNQDYKEKA